MTAKELLLQLSNEYRQSHQHHKMVLSFYEYLDLVKAFPHRFLRNSSNYLVNMFDHYGHKPSHKLCTTGVKYQVFEVPSGPVIGGERPQQELVDALRSFVTLGSSFKLLLLHGPNGSSKSTTTSAITRAMEDYSETDDGALYKFSWIFPKDKSLKSPALDPSTAIGFTDRQPSEARFESLAGLEENKIASKIHSEFRENPIYLLPMPLRQNFLNSLIESHTSSFSDHVFSKGLSKKNKDIFDSLVSAYKGDLSQVFRHIQVERFYLSRHYRSGIATVDPQMSVDASERQLTMDRYLKELPAVLQTINFYDYAGALVDGNRGLIEFSDFLKRPLETFKYLLSTIELRTVHLGSATALLDTVFIATTNDKHWEAFSQLPDFSSFHARIHLITVPYLLQVDQEMRIYQKDTQLLHDTTLAPHTLKILCLFAIMTRLRPPRTKDFESQHTATLNAVTPLIKAYIYNGNLHHPHLELHLKKEQRKFLTNNTLKLQQQYEGDPYYEGKFGASPRFVRSILHSAAQVCDDGHLTAVDILNRLEAIIERVDLYEFLRQKPVGHYHKPAEFLTHLRNEYQTLFENELLDSMTMAESGEYQKLLSEYIDHVVHAMRKEKIFDSVSNSFRSADEEFMKKMEKMIGITTETSTYRQSLISRLASYKIDHPDKEIELNIVFDDIVKKIKKNFYESKKSQITTICQNILKAHLDQDKLSPSELREVDSTLHHLEKNYGYHRTSAIRSLQFCLSRPNSRLTQGS